MLRIRPTLRHMFLIVGGHPRSSHPCKRGHFSQSDMDFWFDVRAVRSKSALKMMSHALIQTHFQSIRTSIRNIQSRLHSAAIECMTTGDPAIQDWTWPPEPMSVAVMPNEPQTFIDPCSALAFFTALQALWQPLALLQPPALPALVPVVTWYVDHIRFPQCFQPRIGATEPRPQPTGSSASVVCG